MWNFKNVITKLKANTGAKTKPVRKKTRAKTKAKSATRLAVKDGWVPKLPWKDICAVLWVLFQPVLPFLMLAVGYMLLSSEMWEAARAPREEYMIDRVPTMVVKPDWLPTCAESSLNELGEFNPPRNIMEPGLLVEVRERFLASPWVSEVISVTRELPKSEGEKATISLEMRVRRPYVTVQHNGRFYWVDSSSVVLDIPVSSMRPEGVVALSGALELPPASGETWQDVRIHDGIEVLKSVQKQFKNDKRLRLSLVDISKGKARTRGDVSIEMLTVEGLRIVWGSAQKEGRNSSGMTKADKLSEMNKFFAYYGGTLDKVDRLNLTTKPATYMLHMGG